MVFSDLPAAAAWRHSSTRTALESVTFEPHDTGWLATGSTTAIEAGSAWWVTYEIELDASFVTRRAAITSRVGADAPSSVILEASGTGRWLLDGQSASQLDGCLDVDLESSAMTNTLPIRRVPVAVGETLDAPAAYVRVRERAVERLEQRYRRREDADRGPIFDYHAPAFAFSSRINYDQAGLVLTYPGIAVRIE
jgi:hypothetical protein